MVQSKHGICVVLGDFNKNVEDLLKAITKFMVDLVGMSATEKIK